jgi:sugar phosphate isomerase/epimerase
LSTSSVFPEPTAAGFEMAAALGYDGVEVMVWSDAVSQDARALAGLSKHYGVAVGSVHAPCLMVTQRVWSPDPWERLRRAAELADTLGAVTVVVHPPFAWQREYARTFTSGLTRLGRQFPQIRFAVENMFPLRGVGREFVPYAPGWDPTLTGFDAYTLDLSHCAASRTDAIALADTMAANLAHVHLGDGTGKGRDEHLVPGRCWAHWSRAASRARSRWRSAPARPAAAPSASPTWPSRSASPASTWPPRTRSPDPALAPARCRDCPDRGEIVPSTRHVRSTIIAIPAGGRVRA